MASIRENTLSNGEQTWAVLYRHGKSQRSKTFADHGKAEKFKTLVDQFGVEHALALAASASSGLATGPTVAELAAQWFDWQATRVQPRTLADYRRDYNNWIDPFLGHMPAAALTEADVQRWVDRDLSRRLGSKSIHDRHAILHGIYKWASKKARAIVPRNPCTETQLPPKARSAPKGLTMTEWLALREASPAAGQDAADLILFLASTGWRIGEAAALTVAAVEDYGGGEVYVSMRQVLRKGVGITQGGKTTAAERRIRIFNSECRTMLRRRMKDKQPGDLVLTNKAGQSGLFKPNAFRHNYWPKAVAAAGLAHRHPTPHWLRHTHVMLCHAAGMSLPEIQRRVGHADIQTTMNVYGRMIGEIDEAVGDRLDLLLSGRAAPVLGEVLGRELDGA